MKTIYSFLAVASCTCAASASAIDHAYTSDLDTWKRATNVAPNGYQPAAVDCPSTRPSIRPASGLSSQETDWLKKRRSNTIDPMRELLVRLNITGFDAGKYIDSHRDNTSALPNIGIAASGGGYRAMLNGAGALAAFDSRTRNSTNTGQIGGVLQASTYVAGLSGGGWLVGSLFVNNFTSVQAITDNNDAGTTWQLGNSILEGPKTGGIQALSTVQYYNNLKDTVESKADALNFNTSLTDYWSRALSFQLVKAKDGGPGFTWSSIADDGEFSNGRAPMPVLVADERFPGEKLIAPNTTVFEFNPWEMGSFDPTLYGFAPLKYIGSNFSGGSLPDNQRCVTGFDNAGFIMGTSSSLFNQIILQLDTFSGVPQILRDAIGGVLKTFGDSSNDIADYTPNPFFGFNNQSNPSAQTDRLTIVDGGEDLQNIPLHPLIQPARAVDVIFAIDSSADTGTANGGGEGAANWPNGNSLVKTYQRSLNSKMANGTSFPTVPDNNTFINLGLTQRPTFFGCDAKNISGTAPLVVYLPNSPYVYNSNTSTFNQLEYNNTERNAMIQNGYNVATMGNGTADKQWPACVGCAILARSFNRTNTKVPDICNTCFQRYCWNGTTDNRTPPPFFPVSKLQQINVKSGVAQFVPNFLGLALAAGLSGILVL